MTRDQFNVLCELAEKFPAMMQLTGSCFFEGHGADIDIFIQVEPNIDVGLISLGFETDTKSKYDDSQVVEIFKHQCGIHVQIVKNATLKILAQQLLDTMPTRLRDSFLTAPKGTRKTIWNWAIRLIEERDQHDMIQQHIKNAQKRSPSEQ